MGLSGLEPPTSRLSGARSNLLSYKPILGAIQIPSVACGCFPLVEMMGFEPMTPCLQGRCSPNWATPPLVCLFFDLQWTLKNDNPSKLNNKRRVLESRRPWLKFYSGICTANILAAENFKEILVATNASAFVQFSIERRWSSRTFRYGYLVTT